MAYVNKRRKYASKKRTAPRRKRVTKPSKTFVKKVNTILRKNIENKQAWLTYPLATFNSAADSAGDILQVMPLVSQGVTESQRIGDDIRAQKLTIKGHMISTLSGNLSYSRIAVRMLVCQPKFAPNSVLEASQFNSWLPYVLRIGGSNIGLNGTIESLYAPVDHDVITCYHDKTFFLSNPRLLTDVGQQETRQSVKFFNLSLKLRNKLLKYNGNFSGDNRPISYAPVILFSYVFLDGTAPITVTPQVMSMTFTSALEFEDA